MNKSLNLLLLVTALTSLITSCKKEKQLTETTSSSTTKKKTRSIERLPFQYYTIGTDILESDFLNNTEDALDEKFAKTEYPLVLALVELYNYPLLLNDLVAKANSTSAKCYNLYTFAEEKPEINAIINTKFASRFSDFSNYGNNWKTYLEANYKYDVQYIPFVSILNSGEIDLSKEKYIAGAYEINEEKFTGFYNNIPLWTSTDFTRITTIDESQASVIDNPIITISNGFVGDETKPINNGKKIEEGIYKCQSPTHVHEYINHKKFAINERYESTGCSEYTVLWSANAFFDYPNTAWYSFNNTIYGEKCKDVSKNNIGTVYDFDFTMFSPDMYNNNTKCFEIDNQPIAFNSYFGFGAYERDWARSFKDLYTYTKANGTDHGKGRRRYSSDIYFFDVASNTSYPFGVRHPGHHTSYTNNYKGYLQTHRWN